MSASDNRLARELAHRRAYEAERSRLIREFEQGPDTPARRAELDAAIREARKNPPALIDGPEAVDERAVQQTEADRAWVEANEALVAQIRRNRLNAAAATRLAARRANPALREHDAAVRRVREKLPRLEAQIARLDARRAKLVTALNEATAEAMRLTATRLAERRERAAEHAADCRRQSCSRCSA